MPVFGENLYTGFPDEYTGFPPSGSPPPVRPTTEQSEDELNRVLNPTQPLETIEPQYTGFPESKKVPTEPEVFTGFPSPEEMKLRLAQQKQQDVKKKEEDGFWDTIGKGLKTGVYQLAEMPGTVGQVIGTITDNDFIKQHGQYISDYWNKKARETMPTDMVQGNLWDNPELLLNPEYWKHNVVFGTAQAIPSILSTIIPGGIAYKGLQATRMARFADLGAKLAAAGVGGLQEGTSTYREIKERGGDDKQAALGLGMMTLASGILNAVSFGELMKTFTSKHPLKAYLTAAIWEGITEYLEEPSEFAIEKILGVIKSDESFISAMKEGLSVIPPAVFSSLLMGGTVRPFTKTKEKGNSYRIRAGEYHISTVQSGGAGLVKNRQYP